MKAQSRLLLDRLDVLAGAGVGGDAKRNRAAAAVERGARNEREAQAIAIPESGRLLGGGDSWKDELDSALISIRPS